MPKEEKGDGLQSYSIREKLLSKPNGKFGLKKSAEFSALLFFLLRIILQVAGYANGCAIHAIAFRPQEPELV